MNPLKIKWYCHNIKTKSDKHLDQLYAALPSDNKPSFPVETVAFSKCLMFIDDREEVTIINIFNQSFRNSYKFVAVTHQLIQKQELH